MRSLLAALIICLFANTSAQAAHRHHQYHSWHRVQTRHEWGGFTPFRFFGDFVDGVNHAIGQIVGHPYGCPAVAFCGCGVSVKVFGHPVRNLWLARNWLKFPRSSPAPGNVAVFRGGGHVAYIEQVYGDGTALVYDPNSGGHQTREHRVSIRGAVVVSPRGG